MAILGGGFDPTLPPHCCPVLLWCYCCYAAGLLPKLLLDCFIPLPLPLPHCVALPSSLPLSCPVVVVVVAGGFKTLTLEHSSCSVALIRYLCLSLRACGGCCGKIDRHAIRRRGSSTAALSLFPPLPLSYSVMTKGREDGYQNQNPPPCLFS